MIRTVLTLSALVLLAPQLSFALTSAQLSKCVKEEVKSLRAKSITNMTEFEEKVLADPKSLRSFVEDSATAASRDANPIARKLMKESATCAELADKWSTKSDGPRAMKEQILEILSERGAVLKPEDLQDKVLRPALAKFNSKIADGFSIEKNPGVAMLAAMYLTPDGEVALPNSPEVPAREKKVGDQLRKAQSADEAEQIIVVDTRVSMADDLESKLKLALKKI